MKRKEYIAALCFTLLVAGMVAVSEAPGQREIIFPEIAALGVGCFLR